MQEKTINIYRDSAFCILSVMFLSSCFRVPIDLLTIDRIFIKDDYYHIDAIRSVAFILIIILSAACSAFLVSWVKRRARKREYNHIYLLIAPNSLAIGTVIGLWMIYAAWQHNPNNSIHWEFYEINYSYLLLIFGGWLLVVGVLTAAAQAAGLALAYFLRRGMRKLAAGGG